ncbi:ATP-binding protein [Sulfuriflexus mobilis]|uniref:ATP-binding protein n=1 Tax=Sulfuriflexus mobilis TaxID=1811807 RepID=UPI0015595593|nr:ATP-binding protein [Sulfuriflexus mobilis]
MANTVDQAMEFLRQTPVTIIYIDTQSTGDGCRRLMYSLKAINNGSARVFISAELSDTTETDIENHDNVFDTIHTHKASPLPLISRLIHLRDTAEYSNKPLTQDISNEISLPSYNIKHSIFSWMFSCHADIRALRNHDILERITRAMQNLHIPAEHSRNLNIIVTELYNNALDHGVLALPSVVKQGPDGFVRFYEMRLVKLCEKNTGSIQLSVTEKIESGFARITIAIKDSGMGFDFNSINQETATGNPFGRGLIIVRGLCKSLNYKGSGNEVEAIYEWPLN